MNLLKGVSLRIRLTVLTMVFVFLISGALLLLINRNAAQELTGATMPLQNIIFISDITEETPNHLEEGETTDGVVTSQTSISIAEENLMPGISVPRSSTEKVSLGVEQTEGEQLQGAISASAMVSPDNNWEQANGNSPQIIPADVVTTAKMEKVSVVLTTAATDIRRYSYGVFLALTLLGGLLVYYWAGKVLQPVQELSLEMQKRTVNNLNEPIENENAVSEIKQLSDAFNIMIHNLNQSFENQKQFNANAAHELRTPIAVLQANLEALEDSGETTAEEYQNFMDIVSRMVERMGSMVESLLQMTQLSQIPKNDLIGVGPLLKKAVDEAKPLGARHDISVEMSDCQENYYIKGNETLFFTAVYNLIENGIKYNQPQGSVNVKLSVLDNFAVITISDTGIGIPEEEMEAVFEPFYRVDKSRSRGLGGAGMGLSLVKRIVECHGGWLQAKSSVGMGSSFQIHVPLWIRSV